MSDQDSLFETKTTQSEPVVNTSSPDYATMLGLIRNEDGTPKYASVEKAIEALAHSQGFIHTLKNETSAKDAKIQELEARVNQMASIQETLDKLAQRQNTTTDDKPAATGLNEETVASLIKSQLEQRESLARINSNKAEVEQALKAKFGEKAKEAIEAKAAELGMTPQALGNLAASAPKAVLAYFNVTPKSGVSVTTTSVNTTLSSPEIPDVKRPEKSLLSGAKQADVIEHMRQIREQVYRKHGVEI